MPQTGPRNSATPAPLELRLREEGRALAARFPDGARFEWSAEFLRVVSPSAEVQGHSAGERKTVPGKKNVAILSVEPVGRYAVRLVFDDMHDTGLFSWDYLYRIGREKESLWSAYLDALALKGLTRETARKAPPANAPASMTAAKAGDS